MHPRHVTPRRTRMAKQLVEGAGLTAADWRHIDGTTPDPIVYLEDAGGGRLTATTRHADGRTTVDVVEPDEARAISGVFSHFAVKTISHDELDRLAGL